MKKFIDIFFFMAIAYSCVAIGFIMYEKYKKPPRDQYVDELAVKGENVLLLASVYNRMGASLLIAPNYLNHHKALLMIQPEMQRQGVDSANQVEILNAWHRTGGFVYGRFIRIITIPVSDEACKLIGPVVDGFPSAISVAHSYKGKLNLHCLLHDGASYLFTYVDFLANQKEVDISADHSAI